MRSLHRLKKLIIIVTGVCFLLSGIVMPYADFTDQRAVQYLYSQLQAADADLNLAEFICDKLLGVGELFEQDDADEQVSHPAPLNTGLPVTMQLQAGVLYCDKAEEKNLLPPAFHPKPACRFRDNKFSRKIRMAIFHPPASC